MAQPSLTQFWPIFAVKSDGQDVVNLKGRVLRNGPTAEQLDDKPNEQAQRDYYREIKKDDAKHIDWRKKLGGMLLREIGGKQHEDKWQQCILWELPENYVLYEHIKTKADGQLKTAKNHSGGGHDRQDAYLYGYPNGPKKRFRSPVEFFPHLLWLCTDENNDSNNCTCKMCSPAQPEPEKAPVKPEVKPEVRPEPAYNTPSGATTVVGRNPVVQIPPRRLSSASTAQSPGNKPAIPVAAPTAPTAPPIRVPPPNQSTPLPLPTTLEQLADLSYDKYLCRTGEVVWFYRPKTSAWGLGLLVCRWASKEDSSDRSYLIQPLSHPFDSVPQELINTNAQIKPWLAWSAPACTFTYLRQNPQLSYGQIDWRALNSGQFGQGVASVDASILAAKAIDSTYTLFEHLKTTTDGGYELRHYNGIYLGAEKIWRGEAVRLRIGSSGSDLMVITDIVERVFGNMNQKQSNPPPVSQIMVIGDIYSYATLDAPDPSKPPTPPQQNNNIPSRMTLDMSWRNRMLVPMARSFAWWKLIAAGSKLDIADVKGRWYETSLVFQESFEKAVKNNEGGNGIWMNSRGDATGLGKNVGVSRPDRIGAFGTSIPKDTQLVDGLDPPNAPAQQQSIQQQQQPQQHQHQHQQQQQHQQHQPSREMQDVNAGLIGDSAPFSIDDFMNVDHLGDDTGMEYGENFHF